MDACFVAACNALSELPAPDLPEVAVAGRSNCGKSSLINAITGRSKLARTSSTPGRTQQIVFFRLLLGDGAPFYLVDLPGYGYARASKDKKRTWARLVTSYIETRPTLRVLFILNDARRAPAAEEQDLLHWAMERALCPIVVLTKADKLTKSQRPAATEAARRALGLARGPLLVSIHEPETVSTLRREVLDAVLASAR
jgi:GTP-binding protein